MKFFKLDLTTLNGVLIQIFFNEKQIAVKSIENLFIASISHDMVLKKNF